MGANFALFWMMLSYCRYQSVRWDVITVSLTEFRIIMEVDHWVCLSGCVTEEERAIFNVGSPAGWHPRLSPTEHR